MFEQFFRWLRRRSCESVILGVSDAIEEITGQTPLELTAAEEHLALDVETNPRDWSQTKEPAPRKRTTKKRPA